MHHQTAKEVYDQKISKKKGVNWPRLRSRTGKLACIEITVVQA